MGDPVFQARPDLPERSLSVSQRVQALPVQVRPDTPSAALQA
jgi:hypothetical protein